MDKITFQKLLRRAFLVPLVLAMFLAVALIYEVQFLVNSAATVENSDHVIQLAEHIYRTRVDQETGLRAYLLTRDESFLQPYDRGRQEAQTLLPQLQQLISSSPEQQARNTVAIQAFTDWSSFADNAIAMAKAGQDVDDPGFQLRGKALMDRYRRLRAEFVTSEERQRNQDLANSRRTLTFVHASVVVLCFAIGIVLALIERKQLTLLSQAFSSALDAAQTRAAEAREQKEWFHTTLKSIGDAVIATNAEGTISFMNPIAEGLTGWTLDEARDKPLAEVFRIVSEQTRETVENPIDKVRRLNRIVGLANHTVLISRNGQEFAIDDSGAPIRDPSGGIAGIVLVFRDITQQRGLEAALQSNERLAVAGRLSASIAMKFIIRWIPWAMCCI